MTAVGIIGMGVVGSAVFNQFSQFIKAVYTHDREPTRSLTELNFLVVHSDFIFICVPTPDLPSGGIDLEYVEWALNDVHNSIAEYYNGTGISVNPIVIIKSTVTPGTTEKWIKQYHFPIAHVPEFLTQRTAQLDFAYPTRIVIGADSLVAEPIEMLYAGCFHKPHIIIMSPTEAEFVKYMSNCFFATKITFMNEIAEIVKATGIHESGWDRIVEGFAASGRVARSHLNVPGPDRKMGYGGACFPKDIAALISQAENIGVDPILLKAVQEKNGILRGEMDDEKAQESGVT